MNKELLVSDAKHFRVDYEINPYMSTADQPDTAAAVAEHKGIVEAHREAGRTIEYVPSDPECPDMVFAANAALVRGDRAVLGHPPAERAAEIPHYRRWLHQRGFEVLEAPYAFSGQGDALPCGDLLLAGSGWRTDPRMHGFLRRRLGYEVVPLRTVDRRWYDLDLVIAPIDNPHTLAWYPEGLDPPSRRRIERLGLDLVEVSRIEAQRFALNLISDGQWVTMNDRAPKLAAELRRRGLRVVELATAELTKGGGGVRCTSLTLNQS